MMNLTRSFTGRLPNAILAGLAVFAIQARAANFIESAQKWHESHQAAFEKANELSLQGETAKGNQLLLELAEKDGGGAAAFIVGNLLYRSDIPASYRLHARAFKAFPKEPAVALEMAMQQHRRGEFAAAIPNYQLALKHEMGEQFSSLLADCLLRTGQLKPAIKAWEAARHGSNHTGIDFAIYEISGQPMPNQRRGDLIASIKAGAVEKLTELILLDLNFDRDWWNAEVFEPGLDADLKLAAGVLGEKDPRYVQLATYAGLARKEEVSPAEVRQALAAAGMVVGEKGALPQDSRLARAVVELVVRKELMPAAELWQRYEPALRQRLEKKDRDALHLLCFLASDADNGKLPELDRLGWKEWGDPAFAVSYVIGLVRDEKCTKPDDPELTKALAALPESSHLNLMRLRLAGKEGTTPEMVVAAIKAEYHELSQGMAIRDSYMLKSLFYLLAEKLGVK